MKYDKIYHKAKIYNRNNWNKTIISCIFKFWEEGFSIAHREFAKKNYLEAIYILYKNHREVRSIDIANYLEVARPTVHQMLRKLVDKGYILYEEDKIVRFTEQGEKIAKGIYERHLYLTKLLIEIGIEQKRAKEEACQIEHVISEDSFQKIQKYFNKQI